MWLILALLAIPLVEIALFIQIGGLIGLWPTLLIVVLSAIVGTLVVRAQGMAAVHKLRRTVDELDSPAEALVNGALVVFAGVFLMLPGFFTDFLGLLLLIPPIRHFVFVYLRHRIMLDIEARRQQQPGRTPTRQTIETEYYEVEPPKPPSGQPSKWTKD